MTETLRQKILDPMNTATKTMLHLDSPALAVKWEANSHLNEEVGRIMNAGEPLPDETGMNTLYQEIIDVICERDGIKKEDLQ